MIRDRDSFEELQEHLKHLEHMFSVRRMEQSKNYSWIIMTGTSISVFLAIFFVTLYISSLGELSILTSLNQDGSPSESIQQDIFVNRLQFAVILSLAAAIIPLIIYSANRSRTIQQQNDELASLNFDIQFLRNRVLVRRQEELLKERKDRELEKEEKSRVTETDVRKVLSTVPREALISELGIRDNIKSGEKTTSERSEMDILNELLENQEKEKSKDEARSDSVGRGSGNDNDEDPMGGT